VREKDLAARGYRILTRSQEAGVDIFARDYDSRFIFFQGHPEYDALALQREYMRDIASFLAGERDHYPVVPASYFDAETEEVLTNFERRARAERKAELAAELPVSRCVPGRLRVARRPRSSGTGSSCSAKIKARFVTQ
jgi:homoserine O-succinyltransferase